MGSSMSIVDDAADDHLIPIDKPFLHQRVSHDRDNSDESDKHKFNVVSRTNFPSLDKDIFKDSSCSVDVILTELPPTPIDIDSDDDCNSITDTCSIDANYANQLHSDDLNFPNDTIIPNSSSSVPSNYSRATLLSSFLNFNSYNQTSLYFTLRQVQRYSSYAFTIFTTLHAINTAVIPLIHHQKSYWHGLDTSSSAIVSSADSYLMFTRPFYQASLTEPILIIVPVGLHITSGLILRLWRRSIFCSKLNRSKSHPLSNTQQNRIYKGSWASNTYGLVRNFFCSLAKWPPVSNQVYSGYLLIPLLGIHILVNRLGPLCYSVGSSLAGFEFVAHGFARNPWLAFPFHTALITVTSWHIVKGWAKWLNIPAPNVNPYSPIKGDGCVSSQLNRSTYSLIPHSGAFIHRLINDLISRIINWSYLDSISLTVTTIWITGSLLIVARGGPGQGWTAQEFDKLYKSIPFIGAYLI